jgi:drug/metabolite transporter (DMT)-like permease
MAAGLWVKVHQSDKSLICLRYNLASLGMKRYNPYSMDRKRITAYIEVTFAVIVWGMSFIATKLALRDLEPVTVVWLRFLIGVIILGIATVLRKQFIIPKGKEWIYFAVLGFLGITFHQWLQSTGLMTSQASTTAWIVATTPVFMAILGFLFLREKFDRLQITGILLAVIGVILVVGKGNFSGLLGGIFGESGDILIMISAINWAVFSIISRRGLEKHQASPMMFYVMAFGWLFTSVLFIANDNFRDIGNITGTSLAGISFLGIFCSGLAYIAWYDGLKALPASQVGAFLYIEPLVAVIVAWLVLGEYLLPITLIGGAIILLGVRLVQKVS